MRREFGKTLWHDGREGFDNMGEWQGAGVYGKGGEW